MKEKFINESSMVLADIYDFVNSKKSLNIKELKSEKTCLVIMDMINGFAKEGALYSPNIKNLIPSITILSKMCDDLNIKKIAFADSHEEFSPEFSSFPCHCLVSTCESQVVDEIKLIGGYKLINKNSTNGFLEPEFQTWLNENNQIDTFIVVGDCSDICVMQFVLTLKTYFNRINQNSRIIVPINMVDTYDFDMHNSNLLNVISLYQMASNDIEIVSDVKEG